MQTPKLNTRNRWINVRLGNESTTLFIANGTSRRSINYSPQIWSEACDAEQMIVMKLDQDDEIVARVLLGKLSKQAKDKWIERDASSHVINDRFLRQWISSLRS